MDIENQKTDGLCIRPLDRCDSTEKRSAIVIGLTGGIATGKSTVAAMFKDLGAKVVSADELVHEMMRPGTDVWDSIVAEFGHDILSTGQEINRRALAEIVFKHPEKRSRLEAIIHPPVILRLSEIANKFRKYDTGVLILEIPLLMETSSESLVDKVLVVSAEQDTQIERLIYRYGIDELAAAERVGSQLPMHVKIEAADWVISTERSIDATMECVNSVWNHVQKLLAPRK